MKTRIRVINADTSADIQDKVNSFIESFPEREIISINVAPVYKNFKNCYTATILYKTD